MKVIRVNEIPTELIEVRDRWRHFWQWIPVLGWFYERFVYHRRMNRWLDENCVDVIVH